MRTAIATLLLAFQLSVRGGAALAESIDVFPGPGSPLQDAIDVAQPGDILRLQPGTFSEAIEVTKALTLVGDVGTYLSGGPGSVTINAGCTALSTISVQADSVRLKGLRILGGTFYGVDIDGRSRVTVDATASFDTCGAAEYGINVFNSTRVKVTKNWTDGYADAGIYVGGVVENADIRVLRNFAVANDRGVIIEDAGNQSVRLKSNEINGNEDGIFLHNSDGISIVRNRLSDNEDAGIELDATSDGNIVVENQIAGSTTDVLDLGSLNCWKDNTYTTGAVAPCDDD